MNKIILMKPSYLVAFLCLLLHVFSTASRASQAELEAQKSEIEFSAALTEYSDSKFDSLFDLFLKTSDTDQSFALISEVLRELGETKDPRAAVILAGSVRSANPWTAAAALEGLGLLKDPDTFETLLNHLYDEKKMPMLRVSAIQGLRSWGGVSAARALVQQLKDEKDDAIKAELENAVECMGVTRTRFKNLPLKESEDAVVLEW